MPDREHAPPLEGVRPAKTRERYRPRRQPIKPAEAFSAGFWGGLGFACAFLALHLAAFVIGVLIVVALGGIGAIMEAVG